MVRPLLFQPQQLTPSSALKTGSAATYPIGNPPTSPPTKWERANENSQLRLESRLQRLPRSLRIKPRLHRRLLHPQRTRSGALLHEIIPPTRPTQHMCLGRQTQQPLRPDCHQRLWLYVQGRVLCRSLRRPDEYDVDEQLDGLHGCVRYGDRVCGCELCARITGTVLFEEFGGCGK